MKYNLRFSLISNHYTMASLASIQFKQMNFNTLSTTVHANFQL